MTHSPKPEGASALETRPSLLRRLQTGDDSDSWQEFYLLYGGLIRMFAMKAGLTMDEAEEVVQETAIGVARGLPNFVYNPAVCRFKTWLLNLTRWRIQNQIRKRPRMSAQFELSGPNAASESEQASRTATVERVPDPAVPEFGAQWDAAWEQNLVREGMARIRPQLTDRQFQAFDLYALKGWPAGDVARTLGMSVPGVYLTKHRVGRLLKRAVQDLEQAGILGLLNKRNNR